jgi:hypothetical protein
MSQIYLTYIIILWFLLQLLIEIKCQRLSAEQFIITTVPSVSPTGVPSPPPTASRPPSPSLPSLLPTFSSTQSDTNTLDKTNIIIVSIVVGVLLFIFVNYLYLKSEKRKRNINDQYDEAENYSYYPVQETVQPPAPVLLFDNDTNRNRNERSDYHPGQEIVQQSERSDYHPGQEMEQQSERSDYHPGQEIEPSAPAINKSYNHGQESIPIANDEIQELKQEIKDLKQIILQSNKQFTSSMEIK